MSPPGIFDLSDAEGGFSGTGISVTMTSTELSSILSGPRQSSAPDWFRELQAKAWEEFEAEPLPTRGNELWRFSSVKNLALDGYVARSGLLRRYLDFDLSTRISESGRQNHFRE